MAALGARHWAIPEGYIPPDSKPKLHEFESHETACLLNASDAEARQALSAPSGRRT